MYFHSPVVRLFHNSKSISADLVCRLQHHVQDCRNASSFSGISNSAVTAIILRGRKDTSMFRLDYISCVLTIGSTILVRKKRWEGWIVAGLNSILICIIAVNTAQLGLIPANLFCLALYTYNVSQWRRASVNEPNTTGGSHDSNSYGAEAHQIEI